MKRLNLRNRECPKCGGKIGVIRRATATEPMQMLGCVGNTHVQVDGTYGYHADDFPKKKKPLTQAEIDKFIGTIRYPKFAAFAVNKLMAKFKFTREQAEAAWKARAI
jgi:hypothetical protein